MFSTPVEVTSKESGKISKKKEETSKTTSKIKTSKINASKTNTSKTDSPKTGISETDTPKTDRLKTNASAKTNDEWGWDNWADDFIVQAAGKVSNLLETVEGQLGIPDPAKMAKAVSTEEQIANSAATNQHQQKQQPQKPKEQQKSVVEESQQPQVQHPAAPTSIIFYSLTFFRRDFCYSLQYYNIDNFVMF